MSHSFLVSYACYRCLLSCYPIRWYLFTVTTSYSIQTIWAFFSKLKTVLPFFSNALHLYQLDLFLIIIFLGRNIIVQFERYFLRPHTVCSPFLYHVFNVRSWCVHRSPFTISYSLLCAALANTVN